MKRLIIISALLLLCIHTHARKVGGIVTSGDEKLQGVIVTDGTNFTQTKKNGKFRFEIEDDAEFVYIITPSGYVADWSSGVPEFYQRAEGRTSFTFNLQKNGMEDDYSIIAMADPQIYDDGQFSKFAAEPMDDMCRTAAKLDHKAVCLVLGDICEDAVFEYMEKLKKEMLRTGIPLYPVAGNNDHHHNSTGDDDAIAGYRRIMGPENYAFFMGKDVVIVLDNIIYEGDWSYHEGYASHVLAWLRRLEALLPEDAELVIAQHSPAKDVSTDKMIVGSAELLDIVRGHKVICLSGHNHISGYFEYEENIVEHNVASIAGSKWRRNYCGDGTPRGYMVLSRHDTGTDIYYKPID